MSDRELQELAAKAAGYAVQWSENWQCFIHAKPHNITSPPTMAGQRAVWVPLNDDGDALRLAVKLGMVVYPNSKMGESCAFCGVDVEIEGHGDDQFAATRRAIVRAAAEVGRRMG